MLKLGKRNEKGSGRITPNMSTTTVAEFAAELKKSPDTLLEQLRQAGVATTSASDTLGEADKHKLLTWLQASHGSAGAKKITLTKKSTSEIKQADATGKARTIQVEVRKKRTFVKREDPVPAAAPSAPVAAPTPQQVQEQAQEQAQQQAEQEAAQQAAQQEQQELARRQEQARQQTEQIQQQEQELAAERKAREEKEERLLASRDPRAPYPHPSHSSLTRQIQHLFYLSLVYYRNKCYT